MLRLEEIIEGIRQELETSNEIRDKALAVSRLLVRDCANAIRATHRQEWGSTQTQLEQIRKTAQDMKALMLDHPDLYYAGYTQDALKEYVEAFVTYALVRNETLPTPQDLDVMGSTYANGLAEAATELRRHILDIIRHERYDDAERMLDAMDEIYTLLMTLDFPDAISGGLRRRVDNIRGILDRTRGELTLSRQQNSLQKALEAAMHQSSLLDS